MIAKLLEANRDENETVNALHEAATLVEWIPASEAESFPFSFVVSTATHERFDELETALSVPD